MDGYYQHPHALVESDQVGDGTRIWAFSHILPGATIGKNCNIGEHCYVEDEVRIGNNVTVKNQVSLWNGVSVEDEVFIGPSVTFTNDKLPRSRNPNWILSPTTIGRGATLGANATLLCGIRIGPFSFVAAGSVVTKDVPTHALVCGNPARERGLVCRCAEELFFSGKQATCKHCGRVYQMKDEGISLLEERNG